MLHLQFGQVNAVASSLLDTILYLVVIGNLFIALIIFALEKVSYLPAYCVPIK